MKLRYLLAIPASLAAILGVYVAWASAAATEVYIDNFDEPALITNMWTQFGTGTITTNNGKLMLPVAPSNAYRGLDTGINKLFDMTNSNVTVEVVDNLSLFSSIVSLETYPLHLSLNGNSQNQLQFAIFPNSNTLKAYKRVASVSTEVGSITYSPTLHRWLRIGSDGTTITWYTSPDGFAWTSRFSMATTATFNPTSTNLGTQIGTWQAETNTPVIRLDNYNNVTPLATREGHQPTGGGVSSGGALGF